tara:strand:- start:1827 stop:2075 length:249 start_codon:yes stop_codon:yes gene_type:complete
MEKPLTHPYVAFDEAEHGPGTTVRLLLDLADPVDRAKLQEAEEWLSDLAPGSWGRWANPERTYWSFVFADDVFAVAFKLTFE